MSARSSSAGLSLIEVVIFIAVLSVGFAAMLILYNQVTRSSVDPLVRKQSLAVAQSLLEEIELMPYTYCDPDDANVTTATSAAVGAGGCATTAETLGPEAGESRFSSSQRFDNVSDYFGFCMGPGMPACTDPVIGGLGVITTAAGAQVPQLADYRVDVALARVDAALAPAGAGPNTAGAPLTEGLKITVTATHVPTGTTVSLEGYRLRYAPTSP